jgi:hypothetical protein
MGRASDFAGRRLFQVEAIGSAAVEAALQLLLIGEEFDRPDRQPDQAGEKQPGGDVHPLTMRVLIVAVPILPWRHPSRLALALRRQTVYREMKAKTKKLREDV